MFIGSLQRFAIALLVFLEVAGTCLPAQASRPLLRDIHITDVTATSFTVVWTADVPSTAALHIRQGDNRPLPVVVTTLNPLLQPDPTLPGASAALGVMRIRVSGVEPDTVYFVHTETTQPDSILGEFTHVVPDPNNELGIPVRTARSSFPVAANALALPVVLADGTTAARGAAVIVAIPGARNPLSSIVGDAYGPGLATVNLTNVFASDGRSVQLVGGEMASLKALSGTAGTATASETLVSNDGRGVLQERSAVLVLQTAVDSDGDGIPDAYESANGLDPNDADDAFEDLDHDGVPNREEYRRASNPNAVDTDGDGVADGAEQSSRTYATLVDTDFDGRPDGDEINGPIFSSPINYDTDNDGFEDGVEVSAGTSPTNPGSFPLTDRDADGVQDSADNCVTTPNPGQQNLDNDTMGDACDTDDDNDHVADLVDNCPRIANQNQMDSDGNGEGDACQATPTPTRTPTFTATLRSPTPTASQTPTPTAIRPVSLLRLSKSAAPNAVAFDDSVTYTLTATNDGPDTAVDAQIIDELPAGMTFESASAGCNHNHGTVTCSLGSLAVGASTARTISVRAAQSGRIINAASVGAPGLEPQRWFSDEVYPGGTTINLFRVADLNGDGADDLVDLDHAASEVGVRLSQGDGRYGDRATYGVADPTFVPARLPRDLLVADLNGDSRPEIMTLNTDNWVTVLVNNGSAQFEERNDSTPATGLPTSLAFGYGALADVTGDGRLDLIEPLTTQPLSGGLLIYTGVANAQFASAITTEANLAGTTLLLPGDLNGDNETDLLAIRPVPVGGGSMIDVLRPFDTLIRIRLGNGDGSFSALLSMVSVGFPTVATLADENDDGELDLLVVLKFINCEYDADFPCPATEAHRIAKTAVFYGQGDGTFAQPVYTLIDEADVEAQFAQLNDDTHLDLALAIDAEGVAIRFGHGTGSFDGGADYAFSAHHSLQTGDANGDDRLDLFTVNDFNAAVLLNQGTGTFVMEPDFPVVRGSRTLATGDVDGDGNLDVVAAPDFAGSTALNTTMLFGDGTGGFPRRMAVAPLDVVSVVTQATPPYGFDLQLADNSHFPWAGYVQVGTRDFQYYTIDNNRLRIAFDDVGAAGVPAGTEVRAIVPAKGLAIGDMNHDGRNDLVSWYASSGFSPLFGTARQCGISVRLGTADSSVLGPAIVVFELDPFFSNQCPDSSAIVLHDMNQDGALDLVMSDTIFLGDGTGALPTRTTYASNGPWPFVVADLDDNGTPDVLRVEYDPALRPYLNDGNGTLTAQSGSGGVSGVVRNIALGDINRDGFSDVVAAREPSSPQDPGAVSIYLGDGQRSFSNVGETLPSAQAQKADLADFDGDGHLDILATQLGGRRAAARIARGQDDGTFASAIEVRIGDDAWDLGTADFNDDGAPDFATLNALPDSDLSFGVLLPADLCIAGATRPQCNDSVSVRLNRSTNFAAAVVQVDPGPPTPTRTQTVPVTPSPTYTYIPTGAPTVTPTQTPSRTRTPSPSPTPTRTATAPIGPPTLPPASSCSLAPQTNCSVPGKSSFLLHDSINPSTSAITFRWGRGSIPGSAAFGDPLTTANYAMCVYSNGQLIAAADAPAADDCGNGPCWKAMALGFKYTDKLATPNGLTLLKLSAGATPERAKIKAKAKGALLNITLPPTLSSTVTVQVVNANGASCWGDEYSGLEITYFDGLKIKARASQ